MPMPPIRSMSQYWTTATTVIIAIGQMRLQSIIVVNSFFYPSRVPRQWIHKIEGEGKSTPKEQ
eukprot:scaffold41719_cov66-Cyclotella_meneghiniana.AAC.2